MFKPDHRNRKSGKLYEVLFRGHMETDYPLSAALLADRPEAADANPSPRPNRSEI